MTSMPPLPAKTSLAFIPDSNEALSSELTRLAGHINAAQYRFLKLLAAHIERKVWGGGNGIKSPAHWLNYYCGIAHGAAREKVRVAKALADLPQIDAAFASGTISYSKVRAMTRTATPENEATLLNVAKHGSAEHVEKLLRQHRRVQRLNRNDNGDNSDNSDPASRHQSRSLTYYYDEDGMLAIRGRFAPEEGAVIVKALEAALDAIEREKVAGQDQGDARVAAENVPAGTPDQTIPQTTFPQKRADALARLAEHFLASGHEAYQSLSNGDKYQVMVHLDARPNSPLRQIGMPAHLDDGPPLADSTYRRLACDASLIPVLRDDSGNVLNIGRKSRAVPPAIRRALKIRDSGCRYPGCCQTNYVDAHHIQHWCDGGETSLENLLLLCRQHHRMLHEGGFSIEKASTTTAAPTFRDRRGEVIAPALYPQFQVGFAGGEEEIDLERDNARLGLVIDAETTVTRWQGERMDYGMAMDALMRGC